jgi:hypothetical protein
MDSAMSDRLHWARLLAFVTGLARVCSVIARSTASRSMLDAPKNRCTPRVCSRMKRVSSGLGREQLPTSQYHCIA